MKKLSLILFTVLVSFTGFAQGIVFETGSWSELLAKAAQTGKPVFVDVFTTWCGPCKMMTKDIFPLESVGKVYNESFVNYQLDAEKGEGVELAKKYGIKGYPTYLYLKPDGSVFYRFMGSMKADFFLSQTQKALSEAADPMTIADWDKEYPEHKTDTAFLKGYINKRSKLNIPSVELLDEYLKLIPESEQQLAPMCNLLFGQFENIKVGTLAFDYLIKNHEIIEMKNPKIVYPFLESLIASSVNEAARVRDEKKLQACVDALSKLPASKITIAPDYLYVMYYRYIKDTKNYFKHIILLCNNHYMKIPVESLDQKGKINTAAILNDFAWQMFEATVGKDTMLMAVEWSKRSLELMPSNYAYMDTQACLLYKSGKKKEAIALEKKALELIDKSSFDHEKYLMVIKRMKAGEKIWEK